MSTRKQAMAAQFTEVTLEDMDRFLKRGWRALKPSVGKDRGEVYYDLHLSPYVVIRVWTSIGANQNSGADVGDDAIRIGMQSTPKGKNRPLLRGKLPIVKRTQGWRNSLQDRIEDAIEKYEEREGYWEALAGAPMQETESGAPEAEVQDEQDAAGIPQSEPTRAPDPPPPAAPNHPKGQTGPASFTKLPSGEWGVRVPGYVEQGDKVQAVRKDGARSWVTVGKVISHGNIGNLHFTVAEVARSNRSAAEEPDYTYGR